MIRGKVKIVSEPGCIDGIYYFIPADMWEKIISLSFQASSAYKPKPYILEIIKTLNKISEGINED